MRYFITEDRSRGLPPPPPAAPWPSGDPVPAKPTPSSATWGSVVPAAPPEPPGGNRLSRRCLSLRQLILLLDEGGNLNERVGENSDTDTLADLPVDAEFLIDGIWIKRVA